MQVASVWGFRKVKEFFPVALTELLTSLLDSAWSGSVPSSAGPEGSFEVKGPEGSTGLENNDDNLSCHPLPPWSRPWKGEIDTRPKVGERL